MDIYILNLIFNNQKNNEGIFLRDLFPIVEKDRFLKIRSRPGLYSVINRLEKKKFITSARIQKLPPEKIVKITKKGIAELEIFSKMFKMGFIDDKTQIPIQSQDQVKSLQQSLEKSRSKVKSLQKSIEQFQSQKNLPKKPNTKNKMMDLDESEYVKRIKRIRKKIIDWSNKDEEDFPTEELEILDETAEDILVEARK